MFLNGASISSGVLANMVSFMGDAWPIVIPVAALGLAGLVLVVVRRVVN